MNELERELDLLLGWYFIKKKYIIGLVLTIIGIFILIVKLILLRNFFPNYIAYHHDIIVYNGPMIRLYIGIIMGSIGGSLLLIGLPFFIINSRKKKNLC
ncbi:MAG: hypothetical protein HWN81_01405 [Candidatus Lokiarchaeota archaeon]|nr:hypothetical protein [Candidatus Lokiarchaeota archaeon]